MAAIGGGVGALLRLRHVEHRDRLDRRDLAVGNRVGGDQPNTLLTLHHAATRGQPAVERADLGGARAGVEDAFPILGAVASEGVRLVTAPGTKATDCARCPDSDSPTIERSESQDGDPAGHSPGHPPLIR